MGSRGNAETAREEGKIRRLTFKLKRYDGVPLKVDAGRQAGMIRFCGDSCGTLPERQRNYNGTPLFPWHHTTTPRDTTAVPTKNRGHELEVVALSHAQEQRSSGSRLENLNKPKEAIHDFRRSLGGSAATAALRTPFAC